VTPIRIGPWRIDPLVRDTVARPLPISVAALGRAMTLALEAARAPAPAAIGLILSDDRELAELNERHLGHAGPTDVLSFPLLPPEAFPAHAGDPDRGATPAAGSPAAFAGPPGRRVSLGDVVVSVERAIEQAEAGQGGHTGDVRWSPADELRLLVIHGTLHVSGWDHADPAEEREMRALESRLLGGPGVAMRFG
jgi:probable rRNA maturation factor